MASISPASVATNCGFVSRTTPEVRNGSGKGSREFMRETLSTISAFGVHLIQGQRTKGNGMLTRFAAAAVLAFFASCNIASAQGGLPTTPVPVATPPAPTGGAPLTSPSTSPLSLPSPLPPIFHPMPGLPTQARDLFHATPQTYAPRYDQPVPVPPGGYVLYGPWGPWPQAGYATSEYPGVVSNGFLALQVQTATAQVFVDGLYVGTVNDVRGMARGEPLEAGAHNVELSAPGYESVIVGVRVAPGETTIYRGELKPVATTPPAAGAKPAAVATAPAKTFYVIPGCYAGDKRPVPALLPRTCDVSKLRAIPPVVGPAR
jgi:hypothetical protein